MNLFIFLLSERRCYRRRTQNIEESESYHQLLPSAQSQAFDAPETPPPSYNTAMLNEGNSQQPK